MYENQRKPGSDTDQELIDVLTAISIVSKRLARNLASLAQKQCAMECARVCKPHRRQGNRHTYPNAYEGGPYEAL